MAGGTYVGIDIGTQTIKVVEARGAGRSVQITALGMENTPLGAIQSGMIADSKVLGAALRSLLSKSGVSARRSISAAAGATSVVVRVIEVPRMTPAELAETMKYEVERHIPFAANDVETSFQAIDDPSVSADPDNPNMEVLLAVAQRDMIQQHLEILQAAGLKPDVIDVEPLAAGRAVINLNKGDLPAKNVVVVNMGASNTDVGVFKNGLLRFPRTIPLAGDNITRAIADHLGVSMDAAEDEKRENAVVLLDLVQDSTPDFTTGAAAGEEGAGTTPFDFGGIPVNTPFASPDAAAAADPNVVVGAAADNPFAEPVVEVMDSAGVGGGESPFAAPESADSPFDAPAAPLAPVVESDPRAQRRRDIFDAIFPVLGELAMELRRSVDYFRSRYPNDSVDRVILCGGSARLPNLEQFIERELGVPTVVADPFAGVTVTSKHLSPERLNQVAPAFTVAVGLATREALLGGGK